MEIVSRKLSGTGCRGAVASTCCIEAIISWSYIDHAVIHGNVATLESFIGFCHNNVATIYDQSHIWVNTVISGYQFKGSSIDFNRSIAVDTIICYRIIAVTTCTGRTIGCCCVCRNRSCCFRYIDCRSCLNCLVASVLRGGCCILCRCWQSFRIQIQGPVSWNSVSVFGNYDNISLIDLHISQFCQCWISCYIRCIQCRFNPICIGMNGNDGIFYRKSCLTSNSIMTSRTAIRSADRNAGI